MRISVRTKILSGFILLFILFISVLIWCLIQMQQIHAQLTIVQQGYLPLTRDVARIEYNQQAMEQYLDPDFLLGRDQLPADLYRSLSELHLSRIEDSLTLGRERVEEALRMSGGMSEESALHIVQQQFDIIHKKFSEYSALSRNVFMLVKAGKLQDARALLPEMRERMKATSRAIRDLAEMLERRMEAAVVLTRKQQERTVWMVALLSAVSVVFGLLMIGVTHLVLRPISTLIEGVKRVAGGDYEHRVQAEADDEIGELAREFNAMARSLAQRDASLKRSRGELEQAYDDLKRTHQRLKTLSMYNESIIRSIGIGLMVFDRGGEVTTINAAAKALLPFRPSGGEHGEMVGEGEFEAIFQLVHEVLEGEGTRRLDGLKLERSGGSRLLDCRSVPLVDDRGEIAGAILLVEDVTERTRTRQRLMQSERLALIGRMSAQVTHEIRNPLNALSLNAELLDDEIQALDPKKTTDAWPLLHSIRKEIDRLTEITESYLRLARSPQARLEREDFESVVRDVVTFVREELATHGIRIQMEFEDRLPPVLIDDNQMRQALLNLIGNAREAMPEGGLLTFRLRSLDEGVLLELSDTGEGMDPEDLERIFDPFFTTRAAGTGLGVPITQQIIEQHGGRLICRSEPGQGTTFRIWLPAS